MSNKNKAELLAQYKKLSPKEKNIVEICGLLYEAISQTLLVELLREIGVKDEKGTSYTSTTLRTTKEKLLASHLLTFIEPASSTYFKCNEAIADEVAENLINNKKEAEKALEVIRRKFPMIHSYWYTSQPTHFIRCIREARIGLFQGDVNLIDEALSYAKRYFPEQVRNYHFFLDFFNNPFDLEKLKKYSLPIQVSASIEITNQSLAQLLPCDGFIDYLYSCKDFSDENYGRVFRDLLATLLIFKGNLKEAEKICQIDKEHSTNANARLATIEFLKGNNDTAIQIFSTALESYRQKNNNKKLFFPQITGVFFILALIKKGEISLLPIIYAYIKSIEKDNAYLPLYNLLYALLKNQESQTIEANRVLDVLVPNSAIERLLKILVVYWGKAEKARFFSSIARDNYNLALKNGYDWFTFEYANILTQISNYDQNYAGKIEEIKERTGFESLLQVVPKEEEWSRIIKALEYLGSNVKNKRSDNQSRLAWFIDFESKQITPKEQKMSKSGWSAGRNVALKRLREGDLDSMTAQDLRVAGAAIMYENHGYYGGNQYYIDFSKAIVHLVGHPLLFLENSGVLCELVKVEPELLIESKGKNYEVGFSIPIEGVGVNVIKETPTRYQVVEVSETHAKIAEILGKRRITVPEQAKDHLARAITNIGGLVTVHSVIGEHGKEIPKVEPDNRIHVHLLPYNLGFKLEFFVKPFASVPPYFKPAIGNHNVFTTIDGQKTQTIRDFKEEKANAREVIKASATLSNYDDGSYEWLFEEPEDCLNVLLDLDLIKGKIVIEWPEGEKLRITGKASFENLYLKVNQGKDWFDVSGELRLDDKVISMQQLLQLMENSKGRFIQLDDGKFLALTEEFRKRLKEIGAYSDTTKDGLRFHNLASLAFQDFADELKNIEVDKKWKEQIKKIKEAQSIQPQVPSTLQAELRPYQVEGYQWLARLAHWGVGACLADDMGLGKTIQALAIILDRAEKAPTLVVAPATVTRNWVSEAEKFAPTLKPILFGGKDREGLLKNLQPYDLVICSYGLLQQEADFFSETSWATVVLDEAQYIKNMNTKRSKAAMSLQADFKIITTGTPIENHLGELWNLFKFINPGLLGSLEKFNERFAIPIEKNLDKEKRKQLQKLIQPFILRRRKSQVLDELPSKTEITLTVEMSDEEMALYEALRINAIQKINNVEGNDNDKRFQILAEIMKLRRMCCNAKLVMPDTQIESSKLNLLSEIVDELLENGHKALIFSQFVGHLELIKEQISKKGIKYQYLDGSTPLKQRQDAINAFQRGEGEVFLISLKAGGVGLNLTAADYVIHMDPWWNPAVEDQASDRAHRIGQQRPVTIYRLVTKGTIEEKIVKLHQDKRDLADSLLEGTEVSGKMSTEELLALIQEM
ncbi:DEAD/DEAH box helicase [Thermoflexibacter ruber]|uniref:Superfamily II DNA or RNA helicase, SNF2 family n=1 Tax=Thermoflexibacter ruber TaxID=1003 RepID=A0A1I2EUN8_9BACT|nr:DEAD/DEAH box helicase [Thermoflexibacter ruber]SFE96802.1 Superfamily II DNA or RNA helicase, SNF2 family [Thermoflexibacter ruber]